jgi:hypothetical protein
VRSRAGCKTRARRIRHGGTAGTRRDSGRPERKPRTRSANSSRSSDGIDQFEMKIDQFAKPVPFGRARLGLPGELSGNADRGLRLRNKGWKVVTRDDVAIGGQSVAQLAPSRRSHRDRRVGCGCGAQTGRSSSFVNEVSRCTSAVRTGPHRANDSRWTIEEPRPSCLVPSNGPGICSALVVSLSAVGRFV